MRILSFSKKWPKLNNPILFTTFRYERRDTDWQVEEVVLVVYKTRTPEREELGIARIIRKDLKDLDKRYLKWPIDTPGGNLTREEAVADGFPGFMGGGDIDAMRQFLREPGRGSLINKLTIYWIERLNG